jgi:ATP-binding cassette subfamily C protein
MIKRSKKTFAGIVNALRRSAFGTYMVNLFGVASWRVALALALAFCISATRGIQLLLLVPLMQLVGLDVQQGTVGWLSDLVSSIFATINVRPTLAAVLVAYLLLTSAGALLVHWQTIFNVKLEQEYVASLRQRLYTAIARTNWLVFARSRSSDFTHALTTELDRVGDATRFALSTVANAMVLCVYVLLALRLSLAMTALVFFCGSGLLLMLRRKTRAARWTGEEISLATNGLYAAATEHLGGMKTTKSYGGEERSADLFSRVADQVAKMYLNATRVYSGAQFWFQVGTALALSVILYVAFEVLALTTAGLLLLLFLFTRIIPLFASVQQSYQQFLNDLPAFAGVVKLQERCEAASEPKIESPEELELRQDIRFKEVSFAYGGEGESLAIRNLGFTIDAGKTTAIVGPSGGGKSTVADLIMGLIVPNRGQVLVDGVPLSAESIGSWRRQIGYVSQDTFLFNDTIRANLLWACPEADYEEIDRALKSAAAKEFVSDLPDGLETVLGDRGVRLSGGERQRLALARALLRRPSLLILDEATSALDSENEKRVQSAIEELHGHMTILVITHRLPTIRSADVVYVLEKGHLVESGSWSTLISTENGRFNALCKAQGLTITSELYDPIIQSRPPSGAHDRHSTGRNVPDSGLNGRCG